MARANQEAIETFMSITGSSEPVAVQKLEEHGGNLNEAVNAYFSEGDRNTHETTVTPTQDDFMEIDDPIPVASHGPPSSLFPSAMNPFSVLDPNFPRTIFNSGTDFTSGAPFVSHPRQVREIPIEVKDGNTGSDSSSLAPRIEDVTETSREHGPEIRGTVIIHDEDEDIPPVSTVRVPGDIELNEIGTGFNSRNIVSRPSRPEVVDLPDYGNDIEEEMIRAAIEASKRDADMGPPSDPIPPQRQSHLEDPELAHAVSLSLKTAEQEKALRELGEKAGPSEVQAYGSTELEEARKLISANGRLEVGNSSTQDEVEDIEEQPLVRHRSRHTSSGSIETDTEIGEVDLSPPTSPQHNAIVLPEPSENDFPSEWGGISSEEHDEAVMLEAALFGGIPEGSGYQLPPYVSHPFMNNNNNMDQTVGPYPRRTPRPPSPSLTAQRLIREQQDDEYLASLQVDREKELKAMEEAEARRLEERAIREAAVEEERRKEEESRRKLEEEQERERQLAAKEASLPQEPSSDDENAVNLLVRMPDGSRRGRRFVKTDRLQHLFDFIDVGRVVKPGTYRLVRPYPRRAFGDGESALTMNEVGLTSKQEALFLELI